MKRKVAIFSIVPSPYQRDLFRALAEREEIDLEVFYLEHASPDSPWPWRETAPYERVLDGFWVPFGKVRAHFNCRLPGLEPYDIVIMNGFTSWTAQWLMRRRLRKRTWIFWGEKLRPQMSGPKRLVQRQLLSPLKQAAAIVAIGSAAAVDYKRRFPALDVYSVPYFCDLEPFKEQRRIRKENGEIRFLFCGQMIERKGVDLLLSAFDRIVGEGLDANLTLVGCEAELPRHLEAVSEAGRKRIFYEGFQAPDKLPRFFAEADVFVLPSRYDGWGVVVNQALGAGLPILSSDAVGAAHDLVEPGVNGRVFRAGDAGALADAMREAAAAPLKKWGRAASRKYREWLPERGAEAWVEVLNSVCARA